MSHRVILAGPGGFSIQRLDCGIEDDGRYNRPEPLKSQSKPSKRKSSSGEEAEEANVTLAPGAPMGFGLWDLGLRVQGFRVLPHTLNH